MQISFCERKCPWHQDMNEDSTWLKSKEVQQYCCGWFTISSRRYSLMKSFSGETRPSIERFAWSRNIQFSRIGTIVSNLFFTIPIWLLQRHGSFGRSQKQVKEEICLETGLGKVQLLLFPFPEILYINRFICSETVSHVLAPSHRGCIHYHQIFSSYSANECVSFRLSVACKIDDTF